MTIDERGSASRQGTPAIRRTPHAIALELLAGAAWVTVVVILLWSRAATADFPPPGVLSSVLDVVLPLAVVLTVARIVLGGVQHMLEQAMRSDR
ncbi:MAG: hypothetical protein ACTH2J_07095 [Candidatus Microbacterium stercoravium]